MKAYWVKVTKEITHLNVSMEARLLLIELKLYGKNAFPSLNTLAQSLHVSKSKIQRLLKELEKAKLIEKKHRNAEAGGFTSNQYFILPPVSPETIGCIAGDHRGVSQETTYIDKDLNRENEIDKDLDPNIRSDNKGEKEPPSIKSASPRKKWIRGYADKASLLFKKEAPRFLSKEEIKHYISLMTEKGYVPNKKFEPTSFRKDGDIWIWKSEIFTLENLKSKERLRIDSFVERLA